ncbi:MAG: HlyD family efflux transporter periplasmic adaptor subunit [Gammaproteobacteria bacterium]|jgi:multidrug efflux pump subunit AcrA (membrane-fusion protein)|nr:HlyD family efflux transporter periplasmic adaptor subunit [Gammaproteobacteria bacterium]
MHPLLRRALPILPIVAGVAGFAALKATAPKPPVVEPRERVWRVETLAAAPAAHQPVLRLYGRVEAPDRVRAAAPVAGRLLEVRVRDGDRVAPGELLARLDPRDLEPRLAQARAELEKERLRERHDREALAQEQEILRLAQNAVARADKVQAQRLASESSVDEARQQLARAQLAVTLREQALAEHPARLASLQAKLEEAERDAARAEVVAPFAARIGRVESAAGDQLQPNQAILVLYPVDGLYVRAKVPSNRSEELRAALAAGQALRARGEYAGRALTATLERLGGEAEARGVDALLRLAPDTEVPLGAFVDLALDRTPADGTLALPFAALHGGNRIFVVEDGRLRGVPVERVGELDTADGGRVLVRAPGVAAGTRILATHLPNAVEGLKVEGAR